MKMKILVLAAVAAGLVVADSSVKGMMGQPLLVCGAGPAALNTEIGRRHGDTEIILEVCFARHIADVSREARICCSPVQGKTSKSNSASP